VARPASKLAQRNTDIYGSWLRSVLGRDRRSQTRWAGSEVFAPNDLWLAAMNMDHSYALPLVLPALHASSPADGR